MEDQELKDKMHEYDAEQREDEVVWFYRRAEAIQPKVIVEIGIKEGGNIRLLSTLLSEDGLAVGIDMGRDITWDISTAKCKVVGIKGDSHDKAVIEKLRNVLDGRRVDILFIDGDHSYEGMLADYNDYSPFVRSGGIIAVHDTYYLEAVGRAWRDLPAENKVEHEYNQSSLGIGIVYKQ